MPSEPRFDRDCVTLRSMPFWCVANPLADPFGGRVLDAADPLDIAKLIAWAAGEGYCEATSFHDDDLVAWNPDQPEDDLDPGGPVRRKLAAIKSVLDDAGLAVNTATCSLHGNPLFRNGGLTNPDPAIRRLARAKTERTLRIGQFLGARHFTYWVARDGFEVPVAVDWNKVYGWLAEGLNGAVAYVRQQGMDNYAGATIEPKPNEPRGQMFLPTSGHAVGFIMTMLDEPDFWGVNPELLQHESMALMNSVMTVGYLCAAGKLKFIHFGGQIKAQFDNDFPPLIGPEGLKETAQFFWALGRIGWRGVLEYDCHMLRAEADPAAATEARKRFIVNCAVATDMVLELARRIPVVDPAAVRHDQSGVDLAAIRRMCALPDEAMTGKRG